MTPDATESTSGHGRLVAVNVGEPRIVEWAGRYVETAIWKAPVAGRVPVTGINLAGDRQADLRVHGGPDKAIYAYAVADYAWWEQQLGEPVPLGTFGENLSVDGLDLASAVVGEVWRVGTTTLELAQPRLPCFKLGIRMGTAEFVDRFADARRYGVYLRIVEEGDVGAGDIIEVLSRPDHGLTATAIGDTAQHDLDPAVLERMLTIDAVPNHWQEWATRQLGRAARQRRVMSERVHTDNVNATTGRGRVRTEPSHKRVRVLVGGDCIVDTDDAQYVWEGPNYPQYYLPIDAFAPGVLVASTATKRSPSRGTANAFTVRAAGRELVDAAWSYTDSPIEELRGRVRLEFDAMDAWFEEDEEIFVHPRDRDACVQILPSSRHVTVVIDGVVVADSQHPTFLYETGLPRRTYFSKLDVRMDLLVPTESASSCPYKGTAHYWSVHTDGAVHDDWAWSYRHPTRESAAIAGLVAFYDERVDVTVDDRLQDRPRTHFSTGA